jgi:hypothetical protein
LEYLQSSQKFNNENQPIKNEQNSWTDMPPKKIYRR